MCFEYTVISECDGVGKKEADCVVAVMREVEEAMTGDGLQAK